MKLAQIRWEEGIRQYHVRVGLVHGGWDIRRATGQERKKEEKRGVNIEDPKSAPAKVLQRKEAAKGGFGEGDTNCTICVALDCNSSLKSERLMPSSPSAYFWS